MDLLPAIPMRAQIAFPAVSKSLIFLFTIPVRRWKPQKHCRIQVRGRQNPTRLSRPVFHAGTSRVCSSIARRSRMEAISTTAQRIAAMAVANWPPGTGARRFRVFGVALLPETARETAKGGLPFSCLWAIMKTQQDALRCSSIQGTGQTGATVLSETIRPDRWAGKLRLEAKGKGDHMTRIPI
jgi:hypothetical protein